VAYTGTHDNDTTRGWWEHGTSETEKAAVHAYLGIDPHADGTTAVWPLIRATASSVAGLALYPLQDILELGSEARMNVPSHATGNWSWRCPENALTPALAKKLAALTEVTDRDKYDRPPRD
jgi:4-alpha-glucanotransferase